MIKIDKILCIGGLCEGVSFNDMIGKRVPSPVDFVAAKNFKSLLSLFSGKLFYDVVNDNISKQEFNDYRYSGQYSTDEEFLRTHDDFYLRYYNDWRSGHINFTLRKRKDEFNNRLINFVNFNREVENGSKNMYYLYTISEYENTLTLDDFNYTLSNLPKYVIDNLFIFGAYRNPIPKMFLNKFRCISTNMRYDSPLWK